MKKMTDYKPLLDKLEVALEQVLPERINATWMEDLLSCQLGSAQLDMEAILQPARDLIHRGGKRWRPLVMLLTMKSLGTELTEEHFLLSLCIELPHTGSLIIDDIEDKADTRRGEPTIHKIYGEDMAINSGNFLYFLPTYLLEKSVLPGEQKEKLLFHWLKVMRRLHIGQGLDIRWHNNTFYLPSREDYCNMCRWKTGALASLAGYWGAILGGANNELAERIAFLWENIGVAFQILDDTTNLKTGSLGKRRGDDLLEGKKSYPLLVYATMENPTSVLEEIKNLGQTKNLNEQDIMIDSIITRLNERDALKTAYEEGHALLTRSRGEIISALPDNEARTGLVDLLDSFLA